MPARSSQRRYLIPLVLVVLAAIAGGLVFSASSDPAPTSNVGTLVVDKANAVLDGSVKDAQEEVTPEVPSKPILFDESEVIGHMRAQGWRLGKFGDLIRGKVACDIAVVLTD